MWYRMSLMRRQARPAGRFAPLLAALPGLLVLGGALLYPETARADWLGDQIDALTGAMEAAFAGGNLGFALAVAFGLGVLTSLTPCVYPMIAITVSVFGAKQAKSRVHAAGLSAMFVLGIATLFTILGLVFGSAGGMFGDWLNNLWVVLVFAAIFFALALSMFGLWELSLPPSLQNRLAQAGGIGFRGAYIIGFAMAPLAAPCVGPPMLLLLGMVSGEDPATAGLAMFVYSLGLGLLFFLVGTFAVGLPKSGKWLEYPKSFFGAVLLVMVFYYLGNFLPFRPDERTLPWLLGGVLLTVAGLGLGAIHLSYHGGPRERARKTAGLTLLVLGLTAGVWWAQASPVEDHGGEVAELTWAQDFEDAQALAEAEGRPMLVDFTASWCGACGELDTHTFSHPDVQARLRDEGVVLVKVDMSPDTITDEKRDLLASYQERGGLPLVILHGPGGEEIGRVTQFVDPDRFLEFLGQLD